MMDNSKVNGVSAPPQVHATAAQPSRASQIATDRFSRAMGGAIQGARIPDLAREAAQNDHAYRRLHGSLGGSAMGAVARDVWSQFSDTTQAHAPAPRATSDGELTQMLERMCSALYVGDKSVGTQRVVMALDHVMPGAAAEIVREGVHLSIRLHARTEDSYRAMSSQRDALIRALNGDGQRHVDVSVVQGLGDPHG